MIYKNRKTIDNTIALTTPSNAFYLNHPELKLRHEVALPPTEAQLYQPQGNEVILFNVKKPWKSIRRIYFNVEYNQYEIDLLIKFKQIIKDYNAKREINFPEGWNDEDNLRYIYSTNCNLDKALNEMIDHFKWRKATFPIKITNKVIDILDLGFLYILGRDYQFKPIIICQASVYVKHENEYSYEEWLCSTLFLCQYMCTYLLIPGQIENWIMITDVRNVRIFSIPQSMRKMIGIISDQFRSRLYLNFIVGLTQAMRFLFKIICKFLDESTVQKLVVIDQIKNGKLLTQISADNLEEKYGGKVANVRISKNSFFPPIMPTFSKNLKVNRKESQRLINDNKTNKSKKKSSNAVSPLNVQRETIKQSLIKMQTKDKIEDKVYKASSKEINEEQLLIQEKEDLNKYKPSTPLTQYITEFNNRKRLLNISFSNEAKKVLKHNMLVYDDNKTVSIDNLSTNTFHK